MVPYKNLQVRYRWVQLRYISRTIILAVAVFTLLPFIRKYYQELGSPVTGNTHITLATPAITDHGFEKALASIAKNKTIILVMVDDSQELLARNFYQTSVAPLGLSNILFVSTSTTGCHGLDALHIPCVVYGNSPSGAAIYNTTAFLAKMNVRTHYTLRALELGYSILQTDADMVYYKDPFPYFDCTKCNMEALQDRGVTGYINAGFLYIRANKVTVDFYRAMYDKSMREPTSEDQDNLNVIMREKAVAYRTLDTKQFMRGCAYYNGWKAKRYFKSSAAECPECVVVHNNCIVSTPAKIYRFKEMGQWDMDINGYYSDVNAKYVTYRDNSQGHFLNDGMHALRNGLAIAQILNRTLILPRFQCKKYVYCPLNYFILIRKFDPNFDYRESEFLSHRLVPANIRNSEAIYEVPAEITATWRSVDDIQILSTLGKIESPVIHMAEALSNITIIFTNKEDQIRFDKRVKNGIIPGKYAQF